MSEQMEEFCSLLEEAETLAGDIEEAAQELIGLLETAETVQLEDPEL